METIKKILKAIPITFVIVVFCVLVYISVYVLTILLIVGFVYFIVYTLLDNDTTDINE